MDEPKQFILICAYCQKEFPAIDSQVKKHHDNINFSHGMCLRHAKEMLKSVYSDENQIKALISKLPAAIPDLKEQPELVKLYSKGLFTPQQIQQSQQSLKESNDKITCRFKKLAGINS